MQIQKSVIPLLASSSGFKVQDLNKQLAVEIAKENNNAFIKELVENLQNKSRAIQGDCIKVLDEVAIIKPALVAPFCAEILNQLQNPNNRMVWGAMAVLDYICIEKPAEIFMSLDIIMSSLDNASVITRDHGVKILIRLAEYDKYYPIVWPLYLEQLEASPTNQFPSYAEWGVTVVKKEGHLLFKSLIESKLKEIDQPSKIRRLEKVLKSIHQKLKLK